MASNNFDLVIRGGQLVIDGSIATADIGLRDGSIAEIGSIPAERAGEVLAATGLHVLPGVMDSHVHFREPGGEHKETLATGSRAAVLGGVTSVFEMPNTSPPVIEQSALDDKLQRAAGSMYTNYAFYIGATHDNCDWLRDAEVQAGVAGVKMFMGSSTGDLLVADDAGVERVLRSGRRRVAVHAEDEERLQVRQADHQTSDPASHSIWRDVEAARLAVARLVHLAAITKRPVHVLHVSTTAELTEIAKEPELVTAEATPHHLTFAAEEMYPQLGTRVQVNPPIRTGAERDAAFEALRSGSFDTIGSDHAPHTLEEKDQPYGESPSGFPGVATMLPIMLEHVAAGRLTLHRLVELVCTGPARVFGMLCKGRLQVGYDADLTLVDLQSERQLDERSTNYSKSGWSPYGGRRVRGWPMCTVVGGTVVMRDGEVLGEAVGQPVQFATT